MIQRIIPWSRHSARYNFRYPSHGGSNGGKNLLEKSVVMVYNELFDFAGVTGSFPLSRNLRRNESMDKKEKKLMIRVVWKPFFSAIATAILIMSTELPPLLIGIALGAASSFACYLDLKKYK